MAKFIFKDAVVVFNDRNISGELSQVALEVANNVQENTSFGDDSRTRLPGVIDANVSMQGFWDAVGAADDLDGDLFAEIAAASGLLSLSPDGGQAGETGFILQTQAAAYTPGAAHGEVFAFGLTINGDGPIVRGTVMQNGARTTTANGTAYQVGAALATQTIYSAIHVTAASGTTPTLDVTVESDDAEGFPSAVTRLTHPQLTVRGSNIQTLVGPVTDDWWRQVFTIGGTTPSFTIFGVVAVQLTLTP